MKKILLLAAFMLSLAPAKAELLTGQKATSYSKVVDGWTYITNAAEFMLLVSECQSPDVGEKKIKLACDIEYPNEAYYNIPTYYIKYFNGVFDGMGCTITFKINTRPQDAIDVAFIQELKGSGSEVRNLKFNNCAVSSHSTNRVLALVIAKVTSTGAHIHDIYVEGGSIYGYQDIASMGVFICQINSDTQIDYCAINNCDIVWNGHEKEFIGIICNEYVEGAEAAGRYISNCYIAAIPRLGNLYANFSCLPELTDKEKRNGVKKYPNCFYTDDCKISDTSKDFENLTKVTAASLKSGNSVFGAGWKYDEDALPLPAGLFYWNPNNSYELNIGTYGSSQTLKGQVKPLNYGRFIEVTSLKLTGINYVDNTSYVINDYITNEIGVNNRITAIGENVFQNKEMTTLQLPAGVTTVEGSTFPHGVTEGFITNGNWRYVGNCLYLNTDEISRLMTVVGNNEELTINCQYCSSILSGAFTGQTNLKHLYVNTWFPVGYEGPFEPVKLLDTNIFIECPKDLTVYVKDGTSDQEIIGSNVDEGYKADFYGWGKFYNEWDDDNNRLIQYFPVTRNPAGLSTLVLGYAVKLPADCWAWVAIGISDNKLLLKRVGHVVPANLPVLLSYEKKEGIMHLAPYEGTDVPASTQYDTENLLFRGSLDPAGQKEAPSEMQSNFLTLQLHPSYPTSWEKVGFYRFDGDILPSYVAWIPMSELPANAHLAMVFDGDYEFANPTGVTDVAGQADKASAPVYNLSGQRVGSGYRGMVIRNGRKYIAK